MKRLRGLALIVISLGLVFSAIPAGAHRLDESYIYVDIYEDEVEGRLEFNFNELNAALDLDLPTDSIDGAEVALEAAGAEILEYVAPRFGLGAEGEEWALTYTDTEVLDTENGFFGIFHFDVDETFAATPTALDVRYEVFFDIVDDHVGLFHIGNYWEGAVFANESESLNFLSPFTISNTTESFDLDDPSFLAGFWGVVLLGVDHIRIGTDHILFIVALLLPSVLVFRSARWDPASGFVPSLWRVLKIATAFTVAHSITLTLGGLGVIELPSRPVEIVIALSIILAALHNLRPIVSNREWILAFGFGLFHGLGFAGLLSDLGLDRANKVWSLLAFNIGVEIGQTVIILLIFPTLYVLRRTRLYDVGLRVGSVVLAAVAFVWMMERILDTDFQVNRLVDPFVRIPRAYGLALAALALALAWQAFEQRRGWLRPVVEDDAIDDGSTQDEQSQGVGVGS